MKFPFSSTIVLFLWHPSQMSRSTMVALSKFIYIFNLLVLIRPLFSQQSYDASDCSAEPQVPGSNYLCSPNKPSCDTFIVYRAREGYQTLSTIASLFNTTPSQLQSSNNVSEQHRSHLFPGREIIIPITCSCPDRFSRAIFLYNASSSDSLYEVACEVFEGLAKAQSLMDENPEFKGNNSYSSFIQVPIRCACPQVSDISNGTKYFVTYPIMERDHTDLIARKFGVPEKLIWDANKLHSFATIFPQTTLLIPTKVVPVLNLDVASEDSPLSPEPGITFVEIIPGTESKSKNLYVYLGGGVSASVMVMVLASGVFIFVRKKKHHQSSQPWSVRNSVLSKFSAEFLDGMSKLKHPLIGFSLEQLRNATQDFGEASVIGTSVYCGRIGSSCVAIEQMHSKEVADHVIDILTKINHLNVVKLEGCCYGDRPYLVYEFAENGSLRDCLSDTIKAKQLTWERRMQIAFDIAEGLHYIHCCTKPAYVHRNINSRNVLITNEWKAKITGFRLAKPQICSELTRESNWNESGIVGRKGYLAPEYLGYGQASTKVDIYAFGVILLELLSAKRAITEEALLKDSVKFLGDGAPEISSESLEKLKALMDPGLEGNYPLGDAMCLAFLAKACTEEDPIRRPAMDDILKALSRKL